MNLLSRGVDERVESIIQSDEFNDRIHELIFDMMDTDLDGESEIDYIVEELETEFIDNDPTIPYTQNDTEHESGNIAAEYESTLENLLRSAFRLEASKMYLRVHRNILRETNPDLLDELEEDGVFDILDD